jgi:hypothetical protein
VTSSWESFIFKLLAAFIINRGPHSKWLTTLGKGNDDASLSSPFYSRKQVSEVASLNWVVYKTFVRLSMELNIKVVVTVIAVSFPIIICYMYR